MEILLICGLWELKLNGIIFVKHLVYNRYTRKVFSLHALHFGPKRVKAESSNTDLSDGN